MGGFRGGQGLALTLDRGRVRTVPFAAGCELRQVSRLFQGYTGIRRTKMGGFHLTGT